MSRTTVFLDDEIIQKALSVTNFSIKKRGHRRRAERTDQEKSGIIKLEILGGTEIEKEYKGLRSRLDSLYVINASHSVWDSACRLAFELRRKGLTVLKFSPDIAPWVSEQIWHPDQRRIRCPDGSLCLTFPVAGFKEIKRQVLKYGSQVEVLSPQELRDEVKKEIEKMEAYFILTQK
ncbi:MAG: WYL domain-containing protein [Thermodesulfobacteriota bacterium]|nr:WYL domain-containing protein [Thermodesulfobacteriota bacterium]